ncbi:MAG: hypothetical protein R6W72_10720 [Desulfurivibrionaceae bacterium]
MPDHIALDPQALPCPPGFAGLAWFYPTAFPEWRRDNCKIQKYAIS